MSDNKVFEKKEYVLKYPIPPIKTRYIAKLNPNHTSKEVEEWLIWLRSMSGMSDKQFRKIRQLNVMVAYCYPLCTDMRLYEVCFKIGVMAIIYDDQVEFNESKSPSAQLKDIAAFDEMLDKLEGNQSVDMIKWSPYVLGSYVTYEAMYKTLNESQKSRLISSVRDVSKYTLQEYHLNMRGEKFTSIEQLIMIRRKIVGVKVLILQLEYGQNLIVPDYVWEDQRFKRIIDLMEYFAVYANDIHSFEKELLQTGALDKMSNVVALTSILDGIPIEQAIEKVIKLLFDTENEIFDLEEEMTKDENCTSVTKTFFESINYLMAGTVYFHHCCDRYTQLSYYI